MKITRKIICTISTVALLCSLSTNAFATNKLFNRGYNYSGTIYQYNVNLVNRPGSEKITVVNTCSCPIDVYVGGSFRGTLSYSGSELTVAYYSGGTKNVTIQPRRNGTHSFRIKTTGNNDTITRIK